MNIKNVEFKAKVENIDIYEKKLLELQPLFQGIDHQTDTYFNTQKGRLKLREGNIENALINYERENTKGVKQSDIILFRYDPDPALKEILTLQLGIKVVVAKTRRIYFIDNVKFHFDVVDLLGSFIEVEAIDTKNEYTTTALKTACDKYFAFFGLDEADLMEQSYSDLIEKISK